MERGVSDTMGFEALGLPYRSTIKRLVVSEPARSLIVHFELQTDPKGSRRLFARRFDEARYHELVPHEEGNDIDDPTPSPTTPHVYFNRMFVFDWAGTRGVNWDGLYRVDCETRSVEPLLSPTISPTISISRILGISGDGARLHVVGSSTASEPDRATVHYGVAELDLATLEMRSLTALRATFV
jgi:hypothetical protein